MDTREEEERLVGNRLPLDMYFKISQALAGSNTAGENEVNALRTVMGGAANFRMPSGGLTSASVKSMMGMQDVDILNKIVNLQSQADIKDEAAYRKWYTEQGLDPFFYESAREKWRTSQKALRLELDEQHKADVTRPKAELDYNIALEDEAYKKKESDRQAIIKQINDYVKWGFNALDAETLLTNKLSAIGTRQSFIDAAVNNLQEYIKIRDAVKEGELNKTVGAISSDVFEKLAGEKYGKDPVQWVDALTDYEEQMSAYPGVSTEQYNAGRKKIDDLISKMKAAAEEEYRIAVARPKGDLELKRAKAEERKISGTDVKNLAAARVVIYNKYKSSNKKTDWVLARQELQDALDKARDGGAVFEAGQVDQQYEELDRSLAHLKPTEWTGEIKELKQLMALATPEGKTPKDAAIDRGQAIEAIKMAIRTDPITSQMEYFRDNLNTYAEGIVNALIALQAGKVIATSFYDAGGNDVALDTIGTWPYTLGKSLATSVKTNQEPTPEEVKILRENDIRYVMTPTRTLDLNK